MMNSYYNNNYLRRMEFLRHNKKYIAKLIDKLHTTQNNDNIGFILLRCVKKPKYDQLWRKSYDSIRHYYPENHIIIIDDASDPNLLSQPELYKTTIIQSEYPGRGELLPYYYYLKHRLFETAVILHDSVFLNKYLDFNVEKYKLLWEFPHHFNKKNHEIKLLEIFQDPDLINFYCDSSQWKGCFGAMSIITYEYLHFINSKYDLSRLLNYITTRPDRMRFERIIGCLLQRHGEKDCLLGNIFDYCLWGIPFEQIKQYDNLPIIKVWSSR